MPREEQFTVRLHDRIVGRLLRRDDVTRFVFAEDYWQAPDRPVLGLRFDDDPHARHQAHMRLPPWFSNLLPEGRLRDWIALAGGTSTAREMELLAQVGHDLPGAVRVERSDRPIPIDLTDQAESEQRRNGAGKLWSFSLAGVRLKFSMLARGDRLAIPGSGETGDWILKLPDPIYPQVPRNELAMMALAGAVGIEVPETRLIHRDQIEPLPDAAWGAAEDHAYAIRRFDRGASRERIHIEDMAQVRGFYPDASRSHPGKYSGTFETVGALFWRGRDRESLREFARRLAFNVLIGNGDAHLKNWSLIYRDRRTAVISPAYDLVATFVYRPADSGPEDLGLKLGGSRRFDDIRIATFEALDKRLNAQADLGDIARSVTEDVVSAWPIAGQILGRAPALEQCIRAKLIARTKALLKSG